MKYLGAGAFGFIDMHAARFLLEKGQESLGLDNLNDHHDSFLKD